MAELRQRKVGAYVAYGAHALENRDLPGALIWFAEAWQQDQGDAAADRLHRQRVGAVLRHSPTLIQMRFGDAAFNFGAFAGHENQVLLPTPGRRWAVHDLATLAPLHPPFGDGSDFELPSLCQRTDRALTSSFTNEIVLWNTRSGSLEARLALSPADSVLYGGRLSPDGHWAAAVHIHGATSGLVLWDLSVPESKPRVFINNGQLLCAAFSPDSRRLVTGDKASRAVVRSVPDGAEIAVCTLHTSWVYSCAFSPDGRRIVSGGYDRKAFVWEADTGRALSAALMHGDGVSAVEFSADGSRVATAGLDFNVRVWDAERGEIQHQLRHNSKPVYVSFSPSGRHLLTGAFDGILRIWDLKWPTAEPGPPRVDLSLDGGHFAYVTNQQVQLRSATSDLAGRTFSWRDPDLLLWRLNRDGSRLLTVSSNRDGGNPRLFAQVADTTSGAAVGTGCVVDSVQPLLEFSPDGQRLLTSIGGRAGVWDFKAGTTTLVFTSLVTSAAFAPSGQALAAGVASGVEIWRWAGPDASRLHRWEYPRQVNGIAWDVRGERVLISCLDPSFHPEAAYMRNAATGESIGAPFRHRDGVCYAAFSPDGRKVITCSEDFTAMLWDGVTGGQLAPPLVHTHQVLSAAFSPDGRLVATGSRNGHARVWDAQTGEPVTPALPHSGPVRFVQFAADSIRLFTRTHSGEARVWSLAPDPRSSADFLRLAGLLSSQQSHSTEAMMPQSKESLELLWRSLRTNYPAELRFSP